MANPDFLDFSTEQDGTGAIAVNSAGGWAANNILVLYVATDGFTPTLSSANGYVVAQDPQGNTASVNIPGVVGMHVFWKRAVGGTAGGLDPPPVLAAPTGGGTVQALHQNVYSNCRTVGTPFHKITTATVTSATSAAAPPAMTTTLNGCTVFGVCASENDDQAFNSWGGVGTGSPSASIDSGWHSALGNGASWCGGRGGVSIAGTASVSSTFGAPTRQAQITFALASLAENESFASSSVALGGSNGGATATVALGADSAGQLAGADGSAIAVATSPAIADSSATSQGSTGTATAVLTDGFTLVSAGQLAGVTGAASAAVSLTATATSQLATATASSSATIPLTAVAAGQLQGVSGTATVGGLPALAMGASAIRQKANGSVPGFPASGPLTTLAVNPPWAQSTAYTLIAGTRLTANGNVYECTQSGTSASTGTGPSGTGTAIVDGTCRWNFVGTGDGTCDTQPSGSLILVGGARGVWASPGTAGTDNKGNTFSLVDFQPYAPPFTDSAQALYACFDAVGGTGHTATLDYGNPNGQPDECTVTLAEVIGGTVIKDHSYVEHTAATGSVVTSAPVTTTAAAIILCFAWLDGPVRADGTSHVATFGSGFATVPNCTSLLALDGAGYIQHALGVLVAPTPGTYTASITTTNGEGAALRVVAVQQVEGRVLTSAATLSGVSGSANGTVATARLGAAALTEVGDTVAAASSVTLGGSAGPTEASDTSSGAANPTLTGTGTLTELRDTMGAASAVTLTAVAALIEAPDTTAAAGSVTLVGSGATAEVADVTSAAANPTAQGSSEVTEAADVAAGVDSTPAIIGEATLNDGLDVAVGAGSVTLQGNASITESADAAVGAQSARHRAFGTPPLILTKATRVIVRR